MSVAAQSLVYDSAYQARLGLEEQEYDGPVDMSMVADGPTQTYPGCFGLPYQDHNYGAQPPPTPPQTPPLVATPIYKECEMKEDIIVTADVPTNSGPESPPPPPQQIDTDSGEQDDPTRCICDFIHDDGYMIQCDKCSVWQHIVCMGLDRDSIPDIYYCEECKPRPVDRARAKEFQIRKREFLKTLVIKSHDSSTDTDPEEVNNRLKAYGLDAAANKKAKQKMKLKKRKERNNSRNVKKLKSKEIKNEKENTSNEANRKNKLLVKDFSTKTAQQRKEKLSKKIQRMRAERLSKEMLEDKFSSDDLRDDEKIINTISSPVIHDENAQNPWQMPSFNEWEQSYETARYNQYTTYVQEYLNSTCNNGHHNDIADLVTDGLRVQRCRVKDLKNKRKGLESSCSIPNGQPVIEVIGKVMTRQQYDKDNFGQRQLSPFVFFYGSVFDLDLVIDASDYGNDARFIRRSCQPNATVHHVVAGGQAHFITVATREIPENTEITIPFDYDFKKWNYCVECACLRNNCPVTRYQKRRLRFQKMQNGESPPKKFHKLDKYDKVPKLTIKTPVKSPTKSPVKSPVKSPDKLPDLEIPTPETIHVTPPVVPSPAKMVRRSQVPTKHSGSNTDTQINCGRVRSLRVPSQNKENASVSEPLTIPEPTALRSSEVDPLTSPESAKEPSTRDSLDSPRPDEKKKMTREERKMEAIMKAFEKMEKRNARKASVDQQTKGKDTPKDKIKDEKDIKREVKKEKSLDVTESSSCELIVKDECDPTQEKQEPSIVSPDRPSHVVKEEADPDNNTGAGPSDSHEEHVKEERSDDKDEVIKPSMLRDSRPTGKGKKTKKAGGRRRVRNASGAGSIDTPVESQEENSNHAVPMSVASCPTTPAPYLADTPTADTPPSFRFVKTKRHLMNEWLSEKNTEGGMKSLKSEPLEVAVEDQSMFVTCLPSPRNSMDRLRRNSQTACSRERSASLHVESSAGSAKKRWLRQAMGEGSETVSTSPVPGSGAQSPNPLAVALHSPGGSPPVDFVTPLKKRRLARESLSRDSVSSESPGLTPTTAHMSASSSYFNSLNESFETYRNKNGFSTLFSPLKPEATDVNVEYAEPMEVETVTVKPDTATVDNEVAVAELEQAEAVESVVTCVNTDSDDTTVTTRANEASVGGSSIMASITDRVGSNSADIDTPDSGNTGTRLCRPVSRQAAHNVQISNTTDNVKSSPDSVQASTVHTRQASEQNMLVADCDQACKSARANTLEPDSSDSVCVSLASTDEVECDSGSSEIAVPTSAVMSEPVVVSGEVDSTQSVGNRNISSDTSSSSSNRPMISVAVESVTSDNTQCDSCNSEGRDSMSDSAVVAGPSHRDTTLSLDSSMLPGPSIPTDKPCISSSLLSSSLALTNVSNNHVSTHSLDKLSLVDSSTDKPRSRTNSVSTNDVSTNSVSTNSVSGSVLLEPVEISNSAASSSLLGDSNNVRLLLDNEVTNSANIDLFQPSFSTLPLNNISVTEQFSSVSSNTTADVAATPNRHLKFLNDSNYSTDMTVDSTTQFITGASNMLSSTAFPAAPNYDSDSMDVTSASETGYALGMDDSRRISDDSMTSLPDTLSSTSSEAMQPKEKKKVSLQEYLKRKKERTTSGSSSASTSSIFPATTPSPNKVSSVTAGSSKISSVSSTTTTSPLKLSNPITLDKREKKLPPLPSLPSLPMFEKTKTERKEFKSSSDLLSPIFNRKEKTEEVRKPMSLSERLRQEFGLDDSGDNESGAESKTESPVKVSIPSADKDAPPPPPPPPPQLSRPGQAPSQSTSRPGWGVSNGTAPSAPTPLMSIKTFAPLHMKHGEATAAAGCSIPTQVSGTQGGAVAPQQMLPSPVSGKLPIPGGSVSPASLSNSRSPHQAVGLSNLLSSVKSPQQIKNDLNAQLAAIKAQLSMVQHQQHSLPNSSAASSTHSISSEQPASSSTVNGITASTVTQVYDYGHQSSSSFHRQNSYPSCSSTSSKSSNNSSSSYSSYKNKSPSTAGISRVSPAYSKVSPSAGSAVYTGTKSSSQNGPSHSAYSSYRDKAPSGWNHKHSSSNNINSSSKYQASSSSRKQFSKQIPHKY